MLLAAVHLQPVWSITMSGLIALWIAWYWVRLGRASVPRSRRMIRRVSLAIMFLSLPMFVRALSFVDPKTQQREYLVAWTAAFTMVLIVMVMAALDVGNTLRIVQRQARDEMLHAADELGQALKQHRQPPMRQPRTRHSSNGEAQS